MTADRRACTCHPSEAPQPCQHRYAYSECRRAALVEKVADLFLTIYSTGADRRHAATAAITLIRAEVLEEAAKCAEYRCGSAEWSADTNSGYECAAKEIAALIRALKETKA